MHYKGPRSGAKGRPPCRRRRGNVRRC